MNAKARPTDIVPSPAARTAASVPDKLTPPEINSRDKAVMRRVVGREAEALAKLYDLYAAPVFGLCRRILNED